MIDWSLATLQEVEVLLDRSYEALHPLHRKLFDRMRVRSRLVPVDAHPGETVVVVAEHEGKILYYSDIEDGWELDDSSASGGVDDRGANQFELGHIMWQLFGDPESAP